MSRERGGRWPVEVKRREVQRRKHRQRETNMHRGKNTGDTERTQ